MLVLFETPAGYALFKVLNEGKLKKPENLFREFQDAETAQNLVALKSFHKFDNTVEALSATTALVESKLHKSLRRFLRKSKVSGELGVSDPKLGSAIKDKMKIDVIADQRVNELLRGIRTQLDSLLSGTECPDLNTMRLGLSHSLSRYRLKFSPDKVDTMIVQAISLLDDLDKELNNYAMRCREWYGWHFPELSKLIPDNQMFARTVKLLGDRKNIGTVDLGDTLPADLVEEVQAATLVSMGTDISEEDITNILSLCEQVIQISSYREQLYDYLKNRMQAIAPNLTVLVGELVGARLISHAGSLMNLAKHPASTVQILGAEKALFRALKTKHATPKYGLIYHASLVGQSSAKNKGRVSRMLAAKASLSIRVDALGDNDAPSIGIEDRERVEARVRQLEGKGMFQMSGSSRATSSQFMKYDHAASGSHSRDSKTYNPAADSTIGMADDASASSSSKEERTEKKEKKSKRKRSSEEPKKKKRKRSDSTASETDDTEKRSKKKKRRSKE